MARTRQAALLVTYHTVPLLAEEVEFVGDWKNAHLFSRFSFGRLSFFLIPVFAGWGEWTEWGDCDDEGLQHRTRRCDENQEAEVSLCQGNVTQSRPCQPHEVPGKRMIAHVNRTAADCCRYKLEKLT